MYNLDLISLSLTSFCKHLCYCYWVVWVSNRAASWAWKCSSSVFILNLE